MTGSAALRGGASLAAVVALRIAALPAAAHGDDHATGHTPWSVWVAMVAIVVGVGLVCAGVYLDRRRDGRDRASDAFVVLGTVVALLSMAVFWL